MTDQITPAFLDIVASGGLAVREAVFRATERHRIIGGKSARLLRPGDRVALRDLGPGPAGEARAHGSAVVRSARVAARDLVHVTTADGEAHLVRGSRLVLVVRDDAAG